MSDQSEAAQQTEVAVLAGGCFWGVEEILRDVPGVIDTDVGYTGGWLENPTYHDTHDSKSGHAEAIRVTFDPSVLSYEDLLEQWFFKLHDPTTLNRQGNDVGTAVPLGHLSADARAAGDGGAGEGARARRRASGSGRSRPRSSPRPPGTARRGTTRTTCGSTPAATPATSCATDGASPFRPSFDLPWGTSRGGRPASAPATRDRRRGPATRVPPQTARRRWPDRWPWRSQAPAPGRTRRLQPGTAAPARRRMTPAAVGGHRRAERRAQGLGGAPQPGRPLLVAPRRAGPGRRASWAPTAAPRAPATG